MTEDQEIYNVEPVFNWKCIIFTLSLALGYWFFPAKNKFILLALLYFPYIILAWYDYIYICKRNMGPTYLALFYWWAKPPSSKQIKDYHNWSPKIKKRVLIIDIILLILAVSIGPIILNRM